MILRFSGIRTGKKPSIHPNDYMDNMLQNAKDTMKERGLNHVQLPDQNMGVILYNGQMTGLDNLSRSGDALLEAATDHFLLSFAHMTNQWRYSIILEPPTTLRPIVWFLYASIGTKSFFLFDIFIFRIIYIWC